MTSGEYQPKRVFTLDEANRMLPLVRAITRDIVQLSSGLVERRERVAELLALHEGSLQDPHRDELEQVKTELERDANRLRSYITELTDLGVELKGLDGLVDFPAYRAGRLVLLCWKLDEPEVMHWHEVDAGFAGRQRIGDRMFTSCASHPSHSSHN